MASNLKLIVVVIALVIVAATIVYARDLIQPTSKSCTSETLNHVYNPDRLQVLNSCQTVTGTVEKVIQEADGDTHVRLQLDSSYENLLNTYNYNDQYGTLVLEIVCAYPVTQADAVDACSGYTNTIAIPGVNEHISVSGQYATDLDHGWNEIHPVFSIQVLS